METSELHMFIFETMQKLLLDFRDITDADVVLIKLVSFMREVYPGLLEDIEKPGILALKENRQRFADEIQDILNKDFYEKT